MKYRNNDLLAIGISCFLGGAILSIWHGKSEMVMKDIKSEKIENE